MMSHPKISPGSFRIPHPQHRSMIDSVVDSGLLQALLSRIEECHPQLDPERRRRHRQAVLRELTEAGIFCPAELANDLALMQQMMVPTENEDLSLTLARVHIFTTLLDDVCSHSRAETLNMLRALEGDAVSPYAVYAQHMLREVGRYCDSTFLAIFRSFFHESLVGILMEADLTPEADDSVDADYVRVRTGFCGFWFSMLQFMHPSMEFTKNTRFWGSCLPSMSNFLIDINDTLSCYKEAIDGGEFTGSRIYRRALGQGIPYEEAWRAMLAHGIQAENHILAMADDTQRPFVERYTSGYYAWHLHADRYRWRDHFPHIKVLSE